MEPIIELQHIDAGYTDKIVLNDINFTIREKDYWGIMGPNGAGKTTLLKVILGIIKPIKGEIIRRLEHKAIGYVPQFATIDRQFPISVKEVVRSGLGMKRHSLFARLDASEERFLNETIEQLNLTHLKNRPIGSLSGGELQRTLLGRALMCKPSLLILDEPTTYMDQTSEKQLYDILDQINQTTAIVLVSHNLENLKLQAKKIAYINHTIEFKDEVTSTSI